MPAPLRACAALSLAALSLWCAWCALRAGASRVISDFAARAGDLRAADAAVSLAPADPEAVYARANILADAGEYAEAACAYEQSIALRPRDYVLWVELGRAREESGDADGALAALRESARLAPSYARPRWQLGNALLRAGLRAEAYEELRRAAESDPRLYPNFVQTLWQASDKDPRSLVRDARPRTAEQTLAVVRLLVKEGAAGAGLKALRDSGASLTDDARRTLVADLFGASAFAEAYDVWSEGKPPGAFYDGGFEATTRADEEGFGWRFARDSQGLRLSLDSDSPREGSRSLKVEYAGASDPNLAAVSQLIPTEPGARYRLTFSERAKEIVTGGLPFVEVVSAGKEGVVLASLPPFAATSEWRDFSVEFAAPRGASAVRVTLKRKPCTSSPCPAFGSLWLDAFNLSRPNGGRVE
jgi:tetratricopeptide (TPR) repeat protein